MRKVYRSNGVDRPNQISTAPFTTGVHVITRKYAKASTTSPLGHAVTKGGVLAWAGVGRQKPDPTPKGEQFTRELPFPVALGLRGWSMLAVMTVVIEAHTLSRPIPEEIRQPSVN